MDAKKENLKIKAKRRNISSVSDEESILLASAKEASSKAIRTSRALGLTIKVIKNHEILELDLIKVSN